MASPAPLITDHCFVTPGVLTLTAPALPRHFSRVLFVSVQGLQTVRDPHNAFAHFSIVHHAVELYAASSSFNSKMKTEMHPIAMPHNISPMLDFPGGVPYQIYVSADVPCRVNLKIQHT